MADFPSYVKLLADGRTEGRDQDVERTQFESGMVRQEKRYRSALRTREISGWIEDSDKAAFDRWAADASHLWFNWKDLGSSETRQARVREGDGGIRRTSLTRDGVLTWDIQFTLEVA